MSSLQKPLLMSTHRALASIVEIWTPEAKHATNH